MPGKHRIIFFGTPEFAATSLKAIVEAGYHIVAVVTAPDKPAGRGLQLKESAVKQYAVSQGLPVLQPVNMKDPAFQQELRSYEADLQIVIAFRMMPEAVWSMPPLGTFNLHASLLPRYRGAAPINRAIMNGDTVTGVTTFFLKHEIDTGAILLQKQVPIRPDENAGELHDELMFTGAQLVLDTLELIEKGEIQGTPQGSAEGLPQAPKIHSEDCRIDFNRSTREVYNQIRGLSPYPGAFTQLNGKTLKIYACQQGTEQGIPGTADSDNRGFLRFYCADGCIDVTLLQLEGKKRMGVEEFLRGFRL